MGNKRSKTEEALKLLKGAYEIQTPEDSRTYYKDFSKHYDETFVKQLAYIYPKRVAEELLAHFDGDGTICDIGCGTGISTIYASSRYNFRLNSGFDFQSSFIKKSSFLEKANGEAKRAYDLYPKDAYKNTWDSIKAMTGITS